MNLALDQDCIPSGNLLLSVIKVTLQSPYYTCIHLSCYYKSSTMSLKAIFQKALYLLFKIKRYSGKKMFPMHKLLHWLPPTRPNNPGRI